MVKLTFSAVKMHPLCCTTIIMVGLVYPFFSALAAQEETYQFNDDFIIGKKDKIDLSRFSTFAITEGIYSIDVYTNSHWKGRYELKIERRSDNNKLGICYSAAMLETFGISASKLNASLAKRSDFCGYLSQWRPDETINDSFNISELRMDISVPQLYEDRKYADYVSPEHWEKGIPALNLSYMANYYNRNHSSSNDNSNSGYLGVNSGFSYNGWLLKYVGNLSAQQGQGSHWHNNQTYLQRSLPQVKSKLIGGQFFTSGEFFDSVSLRGLRLGTDDNMLPDGMRSYAPEIRGVAMSNALVTVRQNDSVIHQTQVSPGPFVIDDVYPSGYGNDLEVTIKEADGSVRQFSVPFSSVPQLLRPGIGRYTVVVGKPDEESLRNKPTLLQFHYQYGVNNLLTGYAGLTAFNDYQAYLLGSAFNTSFGALSLDAIQSYTSLRNSEVFSDKSSYSGQSYRVTFNRMFPSTKTSVVLAAYRYASENYFSLNDALQMVNNPRWGKDPSSFARERYGLSYTLNQNLPDGWGGLYFNGRISHYWNRSDTEKQYQLSYNNGWKRLSYSVALQRNYTSYLGNRGQETRLSLNFSYPLSFGERNSASLTSGGMFSNSRFNNAQIGLNGAIGNGNEFSYGVNQSSSRSGNHNFALNGTYRNPSATLAANFGQGNHYRQAGVSASGSLLVHQGGITLSPETGTTVALIEAKNAQGATLPSVPGTRIDSRGYAILPYLRPYRVNAVEIDPKGADDDIVFDKTVTNVVPYENSVVRVNFSTRVEKNRTVHAVLPDGKNLPFGADAVDEQGKPIGIVGQGSMLFIHDEQANQVWVKWARGQCSVNLKNAEEQEVICR
ncbi:fimbria/pilus outer membrane usher protein [Serratia fonticola]|nr:fimbria/pilus outer membrane usher protein [Serratia fonticola]NCG51319.1 fimbria/pilus outer membrane usher protein [Serratia fonticola]